MKKCLLVGIGLLVLIMVWSASPTPAEANTFSELRGMAISARLGASPWSPLALRSLEWELWYPTPERLPGPRLWSRRWGKRLVVIRRRRRRKRRRYRRASSIPPTSQGTEKRTTSREEKPTSWAAEEAQVTQEASLGPRVATAEPLKVWVAQELACIRLGDARLDRRLHILVEQFAEQPTASIPQACGSWGSTKAAYRFFDNTKVSHGAILDGHRQACLDRVAQEELVLVLQDTTSLDYTHHPQTQGLGPLENPDCQGMLAHSALAVSEAGVPLGLLDQQIWTRDPEEVGQRHQRKKRPIEEKESFKWLKGLRASLKGLPAQVCLITVADREADIFDFFLDAETHKTQVLVRAAWNRRLTDPPGYLWDEVARTPVRGRFIVEVGRAQDRKPREATVVVRFTPVAVRPPRHRLHEPSLHPLPLYAIEVREEDPPSEVEPLHWLLLTNRPVESFEEAQRCVRWYGLRWLVERYHFVLKSGCQIEERQLETADRLERCLGVYAIVAWRLLWLTYQARVTPEAPCTVALETHEWQALYCYIHGTPIPPAEPPSLNQAVRWIAQLGGFLGRKHDNEPGVKVLWRGWQRLHDIAETWLLIHPPPDVGNA